MEGGGERVVVRAGGEGARWKGVRGGDGRRVSAANSIAGKPRSTELDCLPPLWGEKGALSTSLALPAYCSACGRPGTHTQQRAYFVLFLSWGDRKRQVSVGSIQAKRSVWYNKEPKVQRFSYSAFRLVQRGLCATAFRFCLLRVLLSFSPT